jgi:Family of unknown function (DUF6176)
VSLSTKCVKVKLKQNSQQALCDWKDFLKLHKEEVLKTLKNEGVVLEAVFLDQIGTDHFLIYVMTSENFEKVKTVASNSQAVVDIFHREFKNQHWDNVEHLENLVEFYNI